MKIFFDHQIFLLQKYGGISRYICKLNQYLNYENSESIICAPISINEHFASQKINTINHFNTTYDIIIEDGSHLIEHQIQHFKDFSKFIKPGGIYIIEDVKSNDFYDLLQSTHEKSKELDFELVIYDLRNNKGRYDDILFVFKKIVFFN